MVQARHRTACVLCPYRSPSLAMADLAGAPPLIRSHSRTITPFDDDSSRRKSGTDIAPLTRPAGQRADARSGDGEHISAAWVAMPGDHASYGASRPAPSTVSHRVR
jgi:hypothetical protein